MPDTRLDILGICGSLRRQSFNHHALQAAGALMPPGMHLRIADYAEVPLYNQDIQDHGMPEPVLRLQRDIAAADAVLIASPEYNFSITGVLKNAIDWVSRTAPQPFKEKPVALLSATQGPVGGARNQYELRKVLTGLEAFVLPKPEIFIGLAQTRFDADGTLTDPVARKLLGEQMVALAAWVHRLRTA